jgi:tRNA(Ile)-lysidine synthase
VIVAVRGGCDSVTLLHAVVRTVDRPDRVHAVHVNHHLRGVDSDDDERLVVATCADLGVTCHTASRPIVADASGIEASARDARYDVFVDVARSIGAELVLTAHTSDDRAETMLLHLGRGSGLDGMAGMPDRRSLADGVTLFRPLLGVPRRVVRETALAWGLHWREDASNDDLRFTRNRVRHVVMPAMREVFGMDVADRMARAARVMADVRSIVDDVVREALPGIVGRDGRATLLHVDGMIAHSPAVQREVVRTVLVGLVDDVDADMVERVTSLRSAHVGSRTSVRGEVMALRDHDVIRLGVPATPLDVELGIGAPGTYVAGPWTLVTDVREAEDVTVDIDPTVAVFDADTVHGDLRWRPWTDGDRFRPLGLDGSVLVSDLLTNAKVPHATRRDVMVLCDDIGIVWVCGHRLADRVKVHADTARVRTATILHR